MKERSFSDLDFALLKDIGYSISASPVGTNIGGTYTIRHGVELMRYSVSISYADWLDGGNGGNGDGGGDGGDSGGDGGDSGGDGGGEVGGGYAAPEPAYIFTSLRSIGGSFRAEKHWEDKKPLKTRMSLLSRFILIVLAVGLVFVGGGLWKRPKQAKGKCKRGIFLF